MKVRSNVSLLTQDELARFRAALDAALKRHDNKGFQFFAGWHGVPFGLCQHHVPLFLPWHRGYLYHLELALQDIDPDVTLPWWDWLTETGIPAAYAEEEVDGDDNVLFSAPIEPFGVPSQNDWPTQTTRDPGGDTEPPAPVPPPLNDIQPQQGLNAEEWLMAAPSYTEMTRRLEALHDNIHGWVGGEMRDPSWAAYDPLFWAHHSMVDRLWRIWQFKHPGGDPPEVLLDSCLSFAEPPAMTPRALLDVKALGYEYAGMASTTPGTI